MYGLAKYAQVQPGAGPLQRLDARVKIAYLAYASVLAVVLDRPAALLVLMGLSLAVAGAAGLDRGRLKIMLGMALLITWGTMFSQALFYYNEPRTVMLNLVEPHTPILGWLTGELNVYQEGFVYGAVQSLRFSSMLVLGLAFCWTTDSAAMFRGLLRMRLPFVLAFMTVTAVRFLPTIAEEFAMVALAVRMRGGRILRLNPWATAVAWLGVLRPVLINCYRRSNVLALSIQSRAFSPAGPGAAADSTALSRAQGAALWLGLAATAAIVILKAFYWLYLFDLFYRPWLRPVYEFARINL